MNAKRGWHPPPSNQSRATSGFAVRVWLLRVLRPSLSSLTIDRIEPLCVVTRLTGVIS